MITLLYHDSLIQVKFEEAKNIVIDSTTEIDRPLFGNMIQSSKTISREDDFKNLMGEISDFARYWMAHGKKIDLKIEGKTNDG